MIFSAHTYKTDNGVPTGGRETTYRATTDSGTTKTYRTYSCCGYCCCNLLFFFAGCTGKFAFSPRTRCPQLSQKTNINILKYTIMYMYFVVVSRSPVVDPVTCHAVDPKGLLTATGQVYLSNALHSVSSFPFSGPHSHCLCQAQTVREFMTWYGCNMRLRHSPVRRRS